MPDKSGATVLDDLPESIIVWEILVRLSPKDALRCRAVRKSWRRATSTRDFLLAHHRHQPSLPITVISHFADCGAASTDPPYLAVFRGASGGNQKLLPLLRYATDSNVPQLHASRDGLLLVSGNVSINTVNTYSSYRFFYVCNPATRQCAALPQLAEHGTRQVYTTNIAGLYMHHPSGEYRVLYTRRSGPGNKDADFYITSIGPDELGRFMGRPPPSSMPSVEQALLKGLPYPSKIVPVLHRGGLHWDLGKYDHYYTDAHDIMVFDTAVETFRLLRRPAQAPLGTHTVLLEMDGALALFSARKGDGVVMDVFVMQDYEDEVWVLRCRIDLSAVTAVLRQVELTMALVNERELLIQLPDHLVRCDIDGNDLQIVECHGKEDSSHRTQITTHLLRESIIPLPFFEKQQGRCASNDPPFFLGLEE